MGGQVDAESQDRILVLTVLLCSKSLAGGMVQGPPGVGKATLVAALAAECGADLIVIGPAEVSTI